MPYEMDAEQTQLLIEEIDCQINIIASADGSCQDATPTVIDYLSQQGTAYSQQLLELRKILSDKSSSSSNDNSKHTERSRLPLWQILAFSKPSWFLNPENMKTRSKGIASLRKGLSTLKTQGEVNLWDDSQITNWAVEARSSLIFIQGSFVTLPALEYAAVQLIEYLEDRKETVVYILDSLPGEYRGTNLPEWGSNAILKQLAVQILRKNTSFETCQQLAKLFERFSSAKAEEDWFRMIAASLEKTSIVYVVINLGILQSQFDHAKGWPNSFLRMFESLQKYSRALLKVMLFCPRGGHFSLSTNKIITINNGTVAGFPPASNQRASGASTSKFDIQIPLLRVEPYEAPYGAPPLKSQEGLVNGEVAAKSSKRGDWFSEMKAFEKCIDSSRKEPDSAHPRVKIAVLDTGLDITHLEIAREILDGRIKFHDFVERSTSITDLDGHGTHCTSLVAKFAPNSEIYVGRVFKTSKAVEDSPAILAEAIKHAVNVWKVDIISLSLGFTEPDEDVEEEIWKACANRTLVFAAAANNTTNEKVPIRFPARMSEVLCVFSSDAHGRSSDFNPPPKFDRPNFMFPGEQIPGAWPSNIKIDGSFERNGSTYKCQDGTSCATPIAAAVAAGVLEFASQEREHKIRKAKMLKHYRGMSGVFMRRMVDDHKVGDNSRHYVKPWKLISNGRPKDEIPILLSDTMDSV